MRNKEAKDYFSKEAKTYYQKHYGDPSNPHVYPNLYLRHRYILELIEDDIKPGTRVLDIGCGSGIMVKDLIKRGCEVWAADISEEMINAAKKTVGKSSKTHYSVQDIEKMDFKSGFFDLVIVSGVIEYLREDDKAIGEIKRVLKKGGIAIISAQNKASIPGLGVVIAETLLPRFIKKKIFTLEQHRKHTPWGLDNFLKRRGLIPVNFAYFHFYPVIIPLDRLVQNFAVSVGKKMERWSRSRKGWLFATGYVVKAKKV